MTQHQYDAATAQALMKLAYQEDNGVAVPYIERDEGLYVDESFREACPPGTVFDWTPADEMDWPGSPNPNTAPFLPVPFTANELAACMLDGPGQSIQFTLDRRIGYPLDAGALDSIHARHRWMRDALEEAYALAAAAQLVVGEFDHDEEARAHALAQQYSDANGQANDREGVFGQGITPDEARARRARAVASVADLKAHARRAQATVADKWKAWRKAMVRQLLQPQKNADSAPHWDDLTSGQRMKRAMELDRTHDPATQQEKTHFWGLLDLIDGKKSEIDKWEAMPEPLPSEALAKEQRLLVLRGELAELETRFNEPYPASPVANNATTLPVVARGVNVAGASRYGDEVQTPERRLTALRAMGGSCNYKNGSWTVKGISALVSSEKIKDHPRSDEKTIRADLKAAAQAERDARSAGAFTGLGQR